jgi:hypothetical protein
MTRTPSLILKFGAAIFAILWTAWMVCWGGFDDGVNALIASLGGTAVGCGWYYAMRRQFRSKVSLPQDTRHSG